jgi:hypothetical protein
MGGHRPGASDSLKACIKRLRKIGYDAHLIVGHSQQENIIAAVRKLGPYDAAFIDGDHQITGVTRDWKNYGKMSRIVSFHDVGWKRPEGYANSKIVEVPELWNKLKKKYRAEEFIDRSTGGNMGIGVVWTR